jgi:hypothetical protein
MSEFIELSKPYVRKEGQKEGGTGLGLNISISILKEHGFSVWAEKKNKELKLKLKFRMIDTLMLIDDENLFHLVFEDACSLLDMALSFESLDSSDEADEKFKQWFPDQWGRYDLNVYL